MVSPCADLYFCYRLVNNSRCFQIHIFGFYAQFSGISGKSDCIVKIRLVAGFTLTLFSIFISILIIVRHKANIKRILNGTESKIGNKPGHTNLPDKLG